MRLAACRAAEQLPPSDWAREGIAGREDETTPPQAAENLASICPSRGAERSDPGDADVIVTDNVKDFPPHVAPRFDIAVRTADDFLIELWRRDPRLVAAVVVEQSRATRRPHFEPQQLLQALGRVVPESARLVAVSTALQEELETG